MQEREANQVERQAANASALPFSPTRRASFVNTVTNAEPWIHDKVLSTLLVERPRANRFSESLPMYEAYSLLTTSIRKSPE